MAQASHTYDSLVNGEEFVSEHFFTTGATSGSFQSAVLRQRKAWDAEEGRSLRDRFLADRVQWELALSSLFSQADGQPDDAAAAEVARETRRRLGYAPEAEAWTAQRSGAELVVPGAVRHADLLVLEARPVATIDDLFDAASRPLGDVLQDGKPFTRNVPKLVSEVFAAEDHPVWVLVLAGPWALLTERGRWAEGRYLAVHLQLAVQRAHTAKGGELDRVLAILGRDGVLPEADGSRWWDTVLTDSGEHAVGVSKELREGIRASIEIIANDVLARRKVAGLPLEDVDASVLARQSLRYLYRILFLLFAEARPEMGLVPSRTDEYEEGYGLARLRELVLTEMTTDRSRRGTHLYASLAVLFHWVREGHKPPEAGEGNPSLRFDAIEADLFGREATSLIDEAELSNGALQQVLQHLLLTPAGKGDRGFISYAELGVNQLGAVYEGLMSYSGSIAEEDLVEVAPGGDTSKGSWVVPESRAGTLQLNPDDFVREKDPVTGESHTRVHPKGSFVFRLAGRERQQSASYYTPEVLTRFVVSQALEELLDQDGYRTTAAKVLELTVCEPALGSGAFAIEAVRQLAAAYLERRQEELGTTIPAEDMPAELAKVKAHIALHQVYGVDLNATAVELAEVSLWLDTMVPGLQAPWFGLRLLRGNSLIGAQRATFRRDEVTSADKPHLTARPAARSLRADRPELNGQIYHFLLPHEGWGSAAEANKSARDLAPEGVERLKEWRRGVRKKLTSSPRAKDFPKKKQVERLQDLSARVDVLWDFVLERLEIAEAEVRRNLDVFGMDMKDAAAVVSRAEIERKLKDPDGAYRRLRRIMDAWCALWFWPLTEETAPPTVDQWIDACTRLLGRTATDQAYLHPHGSPWEQLNEREAMDLSLNVAERVEAVKKSHPWLAVCERIATQQGFFHWELDFAKVFRRGGFDLQVGNPPWVRPRSDEDALRAEFDPWWKLTTKPTQAAIAARIPTTLQVDGAREFFVDGMADVAVTAEFLGSAAGYPLLVGLQPDLYRAFMQRTWDHMSARGAVALLHPESHFTEKKAATLRKATYRHLRRHWQFINELKLFEIDHHVSYGVHVYGTDQWPDFRMASSLYHPGTVEGSLRHDGSGEAPGVKTDEGAWDQRPHRDRVVRVDREMLGTWTSILEEEGTDPETTRMVYPVNATSARVLETMAAAPRVQRLGMQFSRGWDESIDRKAGRFEVGAKVNTDWADVVLQGPHLGVATPMIKQPNATLKNNLDWTEVDLEAMQEDFLPRTGYQPARGTDEEKTVYRAEYTQWQRMRQVVGENDKALTVMENAPALDFYRLAWRDMTQPTSRRSLFSAITPPGTAEVNNILAAGHKNRLQYVALLSAVTAGTLSDFWIRSSGTAHVTRDHVKGLPLPVFTAQQERILEDRALRLNCLTSAYADLWQDVTGTEWTRDVAYRTAVNRRQALVELDSLGAIALGVSVDDLCTIYRTTFPVMRQYERRDRYDAADRLVPAEIVKLAVKRGDETGSSLTEDERTWVHPQSEVTYVAAPPFVRLDRETDMRAAYARFEHLGEGEADG